MGVTNGLLLKYVCLLTSRGVLTYLHAVDFILNDIQQFNYILILIIFFFF